MGYAPWDKQVGLSDQNLTPAAERLATLTGAVADGFEKGRDLLAETAGIHLGESTVQRATEAAGRRIADALAASQQFGTSADWEWYRDALGQRVAYLALDATGVPQQGPGGAKAEGRMAYVGMVFNPLPDRERIFEDLPKPGAAMRARYVSGLYTLAEMGPLLRTQGAQVGMDRADTWVALTDGGNGLESFMETNFPRVAAVILDFWHASEYLAKLAQALHPHDEVATRQQKDQWCRLLQEEGGHVMLATLEEWDWPARRPGLAEVRGEVLTYFRNQVGRMDYPEYQANGWYIGSGAVESGCKTVVNQRLKGTGMRWGVSGSHEVCHVRALYRSEPSQWQAFWRREIKK